MCRRGETSLCSRSLASAAPKISSATPIRWSLSRTVTSSNLWWAPFAQFCCFLSHVSTHILNSTCSATGRMSTYYRRSETWTTVRMTNLPMQMAWTLLSLSQHSTVKRNQSWSQSTESLWSISLSGATRQMVNHLPGENPWKTTLVLAMSLTLAAIPKTQNSSSHIKVQRMLLTCTRKSSTALIPTSLKSTAALIQTRLGSLTSNWKSAQEGLIASQKLTSWNFSKTSSSSFLWTKFDSTLRFSVKALW